MDLQGTPIGNTATGTKNTTDPQSKRPIQEGPGPIANDSLAAESTRRGGAFSQNPDSEPLGVSGDQSTFNTTDTSAASKLPKSRDASTREDKNKQERYPEGLGGQATYPGAHVPSTGYVGGSTASKQELGIGKEAYPASQKTQQSAEASGSGVHSKYYGGPAPNYVLPVVQNVGNTDPNGQNLREGGFESNDRINASWNSDIGDKKDPARAAENKFQRRAMESGPDAGYGPRQKKVEKGAQPYAPLQRDERV